MSAGNNKMWCALTRAAAYALDRHLFAVNTITGSAIMTLGDAAQQRLERYHGLSDGHDWTRTVRIAVVGCALGSMQHLFYQLLDKQYPAKDTRTVIKKILIDQTVCTPVNIVVFIYGLGVLEKESLAKMNEEFKSKSLMIFLVDCAVFVPSQYINFKFLAPKYRLLFTNTVSIMYDTFLSYIKYTHDILISMELQKKK